MQRKGRVEPTTVQTKVYNNNYKYKAAVKTAQIMLTQWSNISETCAGAVWLWNGGARGNSSYLRLFNGLKLGFSNTVNGIYIIICKQHQQIYFDEYLKKKYTQCQYLKRKQSQKYYYSYYTNKNLKKNKAYKYKVTS